MTSDLIGRLLQVEVSALCDVDKTIPVLDPEIRLLNAAGVRIAGPARTVVAEDDHLSVFAALAASEPGEVLVVTTNGHGRAVVGELFTAEAHRRGLAGIVIDGRCRDLRGLRAVGLPVYARGTIPCSGSTTARPPSGRRIVCGGLEVAPGDLVFGDDDGVVVAPAERLEAALAGAEAITAAERTMLAAVQGGTPLDTLQNLHEHLAALDRGDESRLEARPGGG
jgi:regulator of RNase E activity RraA